MLMTVPVQSWEYNEAEKHVTIKNTDKELTKKVFERAKMPRDTSQRVVDVVIKRRRLS
jgi:hypothetical protein